MTEQRHTANTITDAALDALYDRAAVYRDAWHSARQRVRVLSDELTRRAPLLGEYAAACSEALAVVERVRALHQPMRRGPFTICMRCSGWDGEWRCLGVVTDYPCDTLAALDKPQEQRP